MSAPSRPPAPPVTTPVSVDSRTLLQGREVISIVHNGEIYRLRQTRQGKLILTK